MVMMFVGGVVLLFDGISVLFLQWEIYDAGVFCSRPNPYRGKAVKKLNGIVEHLPQKVMDL
jgi:hypothetical protein